MSILIIMRVADDNAPENKRYAIGRRMSDGAYYPINTQDLNDKESISLYSYHGAAVALGAFAIDDTRVSINSEVYQYLSACAEAAESELQ